MNSYIVRQFKNSIIAAANACEIPVEVKRLCIAEVMRELDALAEQQVQAEMLQMQEERARLEQEAQEAQEGSRTGQEAVPVQEGPAGGQEA